MMVERTRAVLETHADHVITPALEDIGADGWREFETIRARGYAAADAVAASLAVLSLAPEAWARHLEARRRRRSSAWMGCRRTPPPTSVGGSSGSSRGD